MEDCGCSEASFKCLHIASATSYCSLKKMNNNFENEDNLLCLLKLGAIRQEKQENGLKRHGPEGL